MSTSPTEESNTADDEVGVFISHKCPQQRTKKEGCFTENLLYQEPLSIFLS